jgi:hypothetical protein
VVDRPLWVMRPTFGMAIFVAVTWFIRPFQKILTTTGQKARTFAFGAFGVIGQMSILTAFIWLCIAIATHIFDSTILQVVSTAVFIAIGALFVSPLVNLIMIPLSLIVAFPLDWLFPLKAQTKLDQSDVDDDNSLEDAKLDEDLFSFLSDAPESSSDESVTGLDEEIVRRYDKVLALDPEDTDAWYYKGNSLMALGRYEEAVLCYDQVLALDPDSLSYDICQSKGRALDGLKRYEEAIYWFDKAIDFMPIFSDSWVLKGNSFNKLGRYEEAIKCYDKAIELSSRDADAWFSKGTSLDELGRHEEAMRCYEKGNELQSRNR